jgi:DNA-binding CsgD family transcriptional regulator
MASVLLERENLLEHMGLSLDNARKGVGQTVLVSGEAGIGKTTLVEHFIEVNRGACRVLWGACEALFTPRPLGPLVDMLPSLSDSVANALQAGTGSAAIFSTFLADLEQSVKPSIVLFEDVHWADHATLDLVKFLGRRMARVRAVLVLTYRDEALAAGHPLLNVLGDLPSSHVQRLVLPPLTQQAVQKMALDSGYRGADLFATTNGNPFYVTEVLATPHRAVPYTVQDAVRARLQPLAARAITLCEWVSILPGHADLALLYRCLQCTELEAHAAMDACVQSGVLQVHGAALRFRHELARLAVYGLLAPQRRRSLHAQVLQVLLQQPDAKLAQQAYHAVQSGQADRVLQLAPMAGADAARLGAHREAAAHYGAALEHAQAAPVHIQAELNEAWSYEAGIALQIDHTVVAARERAVALWQQLGNRQRQGLNLRWLSRLHWYLGQKQQADAYAVQAIAVLESIAPSAELAMAYSVRSQMYMLNSHYAEALEWGQRALQLALSQEATEARIHALNNLGSTLLMSGQPGGEALLEESLSLALAQGFHEQAARAYTNLCSSMILQCRFAEAEVFCREGVAFDREHDLDAWTYYLLGLYAQLETERGRFAEAQALAREALDVPAQTAVMRWPPSLALGLARSRSGEDDAIALLQECLAISVAVGEPQLLLPTYRALAEAYWLRGCTAQACQAIVEGQACLGQVDDPWLSGPILVWGDRLGLPRSAAAVVATVYQWELDGDYERAAQQWQALGAPFEQALCLMRCGAQGLPRAAALFAQQGASLALELTRSQARKHGIRGIQRGPYAASRHNSQGLTARELQIYRLLAEGLSNTEMSYRLNRSVRTVEHHVSNVLAKVGARNRAQLPSLVSHLDNSKK